MNGAQLAGAIYASVAVCFLLAFLSEGKVEGKRQSVAVLGAAILWPIAIGAAVCIAVHAAFEEGSRKKP
jgi:hypothetical protein